jgi:hypothetical protein
MERVTGFTSGIAVVSGVLDLGGFGQSADGVMVWVLPPLDSVRPKQKVTEIKRTDPASPGPAVRSHARVAKSDKAIALPPGFTTGAQAYRRIVPFEFKPPFAPNIIGVDKSYGGPDFTFDIKGHGVASNGLTFSEFTIGFDVPTDLPPTRGSNTLTGADPAVVAVGPPDGFKRHLVHQNHVGVTPMDNDVALDGLGSAHSAALAIVCDCSGPVVAGRLLGPTTVNPGDTVQYDVIVANPTAAPLTNVVITNEFRLNGSALSTSTLNVASLEADDFVTLPLQITAPAGGGVLRLVVSAPGFTGIQASDVTVTPPAGSIVISEMVLDPKQDWSDSAGGNGASFDGTPGTGAIDSGDVWVEIMNPTTGTQNWIVKLTDATGAAFSKVLGPPSLFGPQVRLLSGFGPMTLPVVKVEVVDNNGLVRQTLDITAIGLALGGAVNAANESLTWSFFGSPTAVLQQFVRRPATIGAFVPF